MSMNLYRVVFDDRDARNQYEKFIIAQSLFEVVKVIAEQMSTRSFGKVELITSDLLFAEGETK